MLKRNSIFLTTIMILASGLFVCCFREMCVCVCVGVIILFEFITYCNLITVNISLRNDTLYYYYYMLLLLLIAAMLIVCLSI